MIYLSWKGIESKWNNLKDLEKSSYSPVHFSFSGIHLFAVNGLFAVHFLRHVRIMDYLRVSATFFFPPSFNLFYHRDLTNCTCREF